MRLSDPVLSKKNVVTEMQWRLLYCFQFDCIIKTVFLIPARFPAFFSARKTPFMGASARKNAKNRAPPFMEVVDQ